MTITDRAAAGGFSHVDADPSAAAPISALDEQASLPAIQRLRATRERPGHFFWAVTMFAVGGVRHSPNGAPCAAEEEDQ